MHTYQKINFEAERLKQKYPDLSDFQALEIACRITQIDAFKSAFMVTSDDNLSHPTALEAVAMALGFEKGR